MIIHFLRILSRNTNPETRHFLYGNGWLNSAYRKKSFIPNSL